MIKIVSVSPELQKIVEDEKSCSTTSVDSVDLLHSVVVQFSSHDEISLTLMLVYKIMSRHQLHCDVDRDQILGLTSTSLTGM